MNNKLLIIALATAFSGIALATETPNYDRFPINIQQYCTTYNTEICQEVAAFMALMEKTKGIKPTDKQIQKGNELLAALTKEMAPQEGTVTIKDAPVLEQAEEKTQEVAAELTEKLATPQE